ncbi:urea ABC transporter permease subunit UrtB [Deinococcus misasensis]|uniref:urea ABC transporter permease subunit UrtB n=1 Tax=Deinococcus misasensis TaxID=392413 RepID=UPI000551BFF5|nr:urea ABC transporter permease subunit UrtB [Deinococcus misasensis]
MGDTALFLGQLFNGVSVGSILLIAALGLALSFGLMRVINMAHGEFIMIGGYLAFLAHQILPSGASIWLALPLAFVGTFILGALLETTLIRRLYGRPLDTLLATWGLSLILQQAARQIFGPTGVEVTAPEWLSGAINFSGALSGLTIPHVRIFVIVLALVVLGGLILLINKTKLGMLVRAVNQNREVASTLGVNTRLIDMTVFAIGAGLAGLGGAALALISPVTPTVGQSYIVDAFLVVILGGLGSLAGTTIASFVVGLFSASLQTFTSVSFAKVLLLVAVVAFLQWKPKGIVVMKSRALEEA